MHTLPQEYLPEEFRKNEVDEALIVYKKLRDLLWGS